MSKNMLSRTCKMCGKNFVGGPRAWYCEACRAERKRQQNKEFKERKRAGKVLSVGSLIKCELCGADIVKTGGGKRYCTKCAEKHLKEVDYEQSKKWNLENREKYLKAKKEFGQRRNKEVGKKSGCKNISWDKERRKWKVANWENGKTKTIGRFTDLEDAKEFLDKFMRKYNE